MRNFRTIDQRRQALAMTLAGLAEQNRLDAAAGSQRLFDQPHAFHADAAGFGRKSAAQAPREIPSASDCRGW